MVTEKQEKIMKLMDRGPFKTRPNLLAAVMSTPIYENLRNSGCAVKGAIGLARKAALMIGKFDYNDEVAAKAYNEVLNSLGPERFSKFIRDELKLNYGSYSTAGIRVRAHRYSTHREDIHSGRPQEDFPEYADRSDELLGGHFIEYILDVEEDE
jgi:hypothetical protein